MNRGTPDSFLTDGCGRCDRYRTPDCKVHRFPELLRALRALMQQTELQESMKWGSPCYSLESGNVAMLVVRRDFAGLAFFKGGLLPDPHGMLVAPGPNSQASRELRFTSLAELEARREQVVACIALAVANERAGRRIEFASEPEPMPEELELALSADGDLQAAWEALTPGRRRSFVLYVGGAKQAATRHVRAERSAPKIRAGKGWNER